MGDGLGHSIFPIGVLDGGRFFLGIDEEDEIFLVETWVASFGRMPAALENLISRVRPVVISEGWAALSGLATGMRVLRNTGVDSESQLPFAAL